MKKQNPNVCRFLRDGYRTPREDSGRLYYERWELRMFENIECEWPLFYSYLILFHLFQGDKMAVSKYNDKLEVSFQPYFKDLPNVLAFVVAQQLLEYISFYLSVGGIGENRRWNVFNARKLCSAC